MTALTGELVSATYKDLLQVSNSNAGVDATLRDVEDGEGTASALQLSSAAAAVDGDVYITSGLRIGDATTAPDENTIELEERSSDPGDPAEGNGILWCSDGTDIGADGDLVWKRTVGGVTKSVLLGGDPVLRSNVERKHRCLRTHRHAD